MLATASSPNKAMHQLSSERNERLRVEPNIELEEILPLACCSTLVPHAIHLTQGRQHRGRHIIAVEDPLIPEQDPAAAITTARRKKSQGTQEQRVPDDGVALLPLALAPVVVHRHRPDGHGIRRLAGARRQP